MKIITLTLNPAFDVHCDCEDFKAYSENLATITSKDAGGKGVNISRALTYNGIENCAYVVVGDENGDDFINSLKKDNIRYDEIRVFGRIRENITLHSKTTPETRISFSGFTADNSIIDRVMEKLSAEDISDLIFVFAGRIPDGIDKGYVKGFLKGLKEKGAKVIVDSKSFEKDDLFEILPWVIKPNEEEVKIYSDELVYDLESGKKAAARLRDAGIENVLISLGSKGAVYATGEGEFVAKAPKIKVTSTIGAGDSLIAGFIFGVKKGLKPIDTLRYAVAYGSAACLEKGTNPPSPDRVLELLNDEDFIESN